MKKAFPISAEEDRAIKSLGGFARVSAIADGVLAGHGFQRGLFTKPERDHIRRGRRSTKRTIEFHFDTGKSLRANINDLLDQASELQATGGGTYRPNLPPAPLRLCGSALKG
jgi:hypothetical protein